MTVIEHIFQLMEKWRFSQNKFSKVTGISQNTINDWKRKEKMPSKDDLLTICHTFDITLLELLSGTEQQAEIKNDIYIDKNTKEYYLSDRYHYTEVAFGNRMIRYMQGFMAMQNNKSENKS